jgi:hypothetical protein
VSYRFTDEAEGEPRHIGLIAQEVKKVVPEAVPGGERAAGISYSALVPLLMRR